MSIVFSFSYSLEQLLFCRTRQVRISCPEIHRTVVTFPPFHSFACFLRFESRYSRAGSPSILPFVMGNKVSAINGAKSPNFFEPGNAVNEIWFGNVEIISRLPFGDSDMAQAGWPKGDYPKIPWRPFIIPLRGALAKAQRKLLGTSSKLSRRTLAPPEGSRSIRNAGIGAIIISLLGLNCIFIGLLCGTSFVPARDRYRCGRIPKLKNRIAACVLLNQLSLGYLLVLKYFLDTVFAGIEHLEDEVNYWTKVGFYPVIVFGNFCVWWILSQRSNHIFKCDGKYISGGSEDGYMPRCTPRDGPAKALAYAKSVLVSSVVMLPGVYTGIYIWFSLEG